MGIVKGRLLYNSDKLERLARHVETTSIVVQVSGRNRTVMVVDPIGARAADAYAWMLPGVCDDWGRWDPSARSVLAAAYKLRPDVTEASVTKLLALMHQYGLYVTYEVHGRVWAEWTNYQGDAESRRENHTAPEPPWSQHNHTVKCSLWREAKDHAIRGGLTVGKRGKLISVPAWPEPKAGNPRGSGAQGTSAGPLSVPSVDPPIPPLPPASGGTDPGDPDRAEPEPAGGGVDVLASIARELGVLDEDPRRQRQQRRAWKAALAAGRGLDVLGAELRAVAVAREGERQEDERLDGGAAMEWIEAHGGTQAVAAELVQREREERPDLQARLDGTGTARYDAMREIGPLRTAWLAEMGAPAAVLVLIGPELTHAQRTAAAKPAERSPPPDHESADDFEIGPDPAA